jgi:hypothetical protein
MTSLARCPWLRRSWRFRQRDDNPAQSPQPARDGSAITMPAAAPGGSFAATVKNAFRSNIEAKVARDVQQAAADAAWIKMIIPDGNAPGVVAGSVVLWSHEDSGTPMSEIGWMVLPEFQGRGIAKTAVGMLLALAR